MKNGIVVTSLTIMLAFTSHGATREAASYDPAYAGNVTALFDQSAVINTPEFGSAMESERQKMLVTDFERKKSTHYFEILKHYAKVLSPVLGVFVLYQIPRMLAAQNQPIAGAPGGGGGVAVAGVGVGLIAATLLQPLSYVVINPIANEFERFTATFTKYTGAKLREISAWFSSESKTHFADESEKYEYLWIAGKRNVSQALWAPIENAIAKARSAQNSISGPARKTVDVPALIHRALSLPNNVKTLNFDPQKIADEFQGYDLDSPEALYEFCYRFVSASRLNSPITKIPLYFQGPAGVGKTEAARKLARVLDASVGEVSLEKVTHINDIFGWPKDHEKAGPGLIVEAMIKANQDGKGSKNLLLVFDEAGGTINQFKAIATAFKKVLEPKTGSFYNEYFEADIEISHVGFIFIDNTKLSDPALVNRMQPVVFKGFMEGYKSKVIFETFLPELLKNEFSHSDLGVIEIDDNDKAFLKHLVETDTDKGFRSIQLNVRRYLEHKGLAKFFKRPMGEFKPVKYVE